MLKLLIIDDEHIVREGIKIIINWEKYGFEICGEASDGREGLSKINSLQPDLVLIDIRMPGYTGIEAISKAREMGFKGKIIVLTGYSDFNYIQSAIKLDVSAYILKPIDENELLEAINKVRTQIYNYKEIEKSIMEGKKHIQETILKKIILHSQEGEIDEYIAHPARINFEFSSFQVAVVNKSTQIAREVIQNSIGEEKSSEFLLLEDSIVIIFKGKNSSFIKDFLLLKLYKQFQNKGYEDVFIAVGREVNAIKDIHLSYMDAYTIANQDLFYKNSAIMFWNDDDVMNDPVSDKKELWGIFDYVEKIFIYIDVGDIKKLEETMNEMEILLNRTKVPSGKIKAFFINFFVELKGKIAIGYSEYREIMPSQEQIINDIYDKSSFVELMQYIKEELVSISNKICRTTSDNIMKRLLNYIKNNYNKDLKLETLANIFNYNSAYLGKIFKNFTGESFNYYLDKVRIEKAKELLNEDGLKVYQIAERVGYNNIDYFYSKFRKYVGVSPKEFRKITNKNA